MIQGRHGTSRTQPPWREGSRSRDRATTRLDREHIAGAGRWRTPDPIGRDSAADTVNRKWYGDGTEIVTDEGKLYLDSVLDMDSRRIVRFALGEHHDAELAENAQRSN